MVHGAFCSSRSTGLLHLDAIQGFQGSHVVILLPVGRKFAGAHSWNVQELLDHSAERKLHLFGSGGATVAGADFFHLSVQHIHGVAPQGNDRGVHGAGFAFGFKCRCSAIDDLAGMGQDSACSGVQPDVRTQA